MRDKTNNPLDKLNDMASKRYFDSNGNRLQSAKRVSKSTVRVEICATTGFYYCDVEFEGELKYNRWTVFDMAMAYFKSQNFYFAL